MLPLPAWLLGSGLELLCWAHSDGCSCLLRTPLPCPPAGLELEGVFNARTAPQPNAIALHIFGTPSGTCPPGTALSTLAHNESSTDVVGSTGGNSSDSVARESDPADGGPFGLSANGTVIDLSSSFQSE